MAKASANTPTWLQRLVLELKRDKKRAILLSVLAVVAAVMVARQVLRSGGPARAAGAASAVVAEAASPSEGGAGPAAPCQSEPVKQAPARKVEREFTRDIFLPDPSVFPPLAEKGAPAPVAADSAQDGAGQQAIHAEAAALELQSTILGSAPKAIVNGSVVPLGGEIRGFTLVAIHARSCEVEKSAVRVTLEMKR